MMFSSTSAVQPQRPAVYVCVSQSHIHTQEYKPRGKTCNTRDSMTSMNASANRGERIEDANVSKSKEKQRKTEANVCSDRKLRKDLIRLILLNNLSNFTPSFVTTTNNYLLVKPWKVPENFFMITLLVRKKCISMLIFCLPNSQVVP